MVIKVYPINGYIFSSMLFMGIALGIFIEHILWHFNLQDPLWLPVLIFCAIALAVCFIGTRGKYECKDCLKWEQK